MDIAKLKLFSVVAQHGSISRAAIALGAATSAVSRNITLLERDCSGRLFYRTGRGVALTELGTRLLSKLNEPLGAIERITEEIQANAGELGGTVRVGVLAALSPALVSAVFNALRAKHPAIRLYFVQGSSDQFDEWLANGQIDLAVLTRNSKAATKNEQLLGVLDTYLIGPKDDPLTRAPTIKFSQLNEIPMVVQGAQNGLRIALEATARAKGIRLKVLMESDSLSILKAVVAGGGGYMVSTGQAVEQEVQFGTLQASHITSPGVQRYVTLAMSKPASVASREVARIIRAIGIPQRAYLHPRRGSGAGQAVRS